MQGKVRFKNTYAGRIGVIVDRIGAEAAANAIYRKRPLIYKLADPDQPSIPNIRQAQQLDIAYQKAGGLYAPITDLLAVRTSQTPSRVVSTVEAELLDVMERVGELTTAVKAATQSGSPGGKAITGTERATIEACAEECMEELREIVQSVKESSAPADHSNVVGFGR